jgi:FAD synthetase
MEYIKKIILYKTYTEQTKPKQKRSPGVVLVGGCFDILHIGHIRFLSSAKKGAKQLIVLLESDARVQQLKGPSRPYFSQKERAEMLASLSFVDLVILLPASIEDKDYENLTSLIKPETVAMTQHDINLDKKKSQATSSGAKIKIVGLIHTASTSKVANLLGIE